MATSSEFSSPRSRLMVLRAAEIKFITREDKFAPDNKAFKPTITLVIEDHPQEPDVAEMIEVLLAEQHEEMDFTLGTERWSTPIRSAMPSPKPDVTVDMRRMLRTNISNGRCPLKGTGDVVLNALDELWAGQVVDVQLQFYRFSIQPPRLHSTAMVYANALGFKLVGGVPRGLENL